MLIQYNTIGYILLVFLTSFFTTFFLIPLLMRLAVRFSIVDVPDNLLKKHEKVTPYLGGLGIFAGFFFAAMLFLSPNQQILMLLFGCAMLVALGLVDDIIALSPRNKFLGQIFAVLFFLKAGIFFKNVAFPYFFSILISFFWFLAVINAYNLIDVMDGLSSVVAITTALALLFFALFQSNYLVAMLLVAFIGAVSAFLVFNKPPAKMYMGDTGSLFLGGFLGAASLLLGWNSATLTGFLIPGVILGLPLMELISLIVIRTYYGIRFFNGSRHHFSHYLADKNYSKQQILLISVLCCLYLFFVALLFYTNSISLFGLLLFGLGYLLFWLFFIIF